MRNLIKKHEKQEAPTRTYNWACKATGCPMPATRVTEWHDNLHGARGDLRDGAPKGGCCGYHAGHKVHNWDLLTTKINKMLPLIALLDELDQLSTVQLAEMMPMEIPRYSGSKPLDGETMFEWMRRMRGRIDSYIISDLPAAPVLLKRKQATLQTLIRDAIS